MITERWNVEGGGAVSMHRARKRDKAEERRGKKEAGRTAVR